jgi:hypothetical protein
VVTENQARAIALSMPEAEEKSHFGHPDFRVRNKIFATLWPGGRTSVLKLGREVLMDLLAQDRATFSIAPGGERGGWTAVDLTRVDPDQYRSLMIQSWRLTAPKSLLATEAGVRPGAKRRSARKA